MLNNLRAFFPVFFPFPLLGALLGRALGGNPPRSISSDFSSRPYLGDPLNSVVMSRPYWGEPQSSVVMSRPYWGNP